MKTSFQRILYFSLLLKCFSLFPQNTQYKGDKYFKNRLYIKALDAYRKESKKSSDPSLLSKLAETYYVLQNYEEAVKTYSVLFNGTPVREQDYLNYAMCLKIEGEYEKANSIYEQFLKKYPGSEHIKKVKKFCAEIKYWNSRPKEYTVTNCRTINTPKSEFSSCVWNNKLFYAAEKSSFNMVHFVKDDSRNQDFYDILLADVNSLPKNPRAVRGKANSDYHDACLSISSDGKWAAFSRSYPKGSSDLKKPKIFFSDFSREKTGSITPFEHNRDEYVFTHPAFGNQGNWLFFVSDMPGGYGGTDIWYCERNGNQWSKPLNLGPDVNTPGNELFPYYRENGTLYFSSDGHPGFGGLDIYSARKNKGIWIVEKHETMLLNSSFDDFGICFLNDSIGFFTSNRPGGEGSDDIYQFHFTPKFKDFAGYVLNTENPDDPAKNVKVILKDTLGNILQETTTDDKGFFIFKHLDAEKSYMAYIENSDPKFTGKARYFMTDENKTIHRISSRQPDHPFVFRHLPIDKNAMPMLYTDDNLVLAGNLLYGENPSKALKNTKIRIKNDFGDVVEETTTNEFGAFAFKYLPAGQSYMIEIVETQVELPDNVKITLTNKSGKELRTFNYTRNKALFKILPAETTLMKELYASEEDLLMSLTGFMFDQDKKPLSNVRIIIYNQKNPSQKTEIQSGSGGRFEFKKLDADKNYIFQTVENDPALSQVQKIYLADHKGRIFKVLTRDGSGSFVFKILNAEKSILGEFVTDDPWLEVLELKYKKQKESLTIIENIYYELDDYKFDAAGKNVLDKVIQILKDNPNLSIELSSHTDSRAGDAYNLKLSQKRAQYAVDYIVSAGIDKKRLKAIGYGETKLLNRCANGVECSEEEHKINRRTEFKILDKSMPEASGKK